MKYKIILALFLNQNVDAIRLHRASEEKLSAADNVADRL